MSVNISVSSKHNTCDDIIYKLLNSQINCRMIKTISVVDNNIENGCLITVSQKYNDKIKLKNLWNIIKSDYTCSHLKIDGIFDGCIYDYINSDFCPGKKL